MSNAQTTTLPEHPNSSEIISAVLKIVESLLKSAKISQDYKPGGIVIFSIGVVLEEKPGSATEIPMVASGNLDLQFPCSVKGSGPFTEHLLREISRAEFTIPIPVVPK